MVSVVEAVASVWRPRARSRLSHRSFAGAGRHPVGQPDHGISGRQLHPRHHFQRSASFRRRSDHRANPNAEAASRPSADRDVFRRGAPGVVRLPGLPRQTPDKTYRSVAPLGVIEITREWVLWHRCSDLDPRYWLFTPFACVATL